MVTQLAGSAAAPIGPSPNLEVDPVFQVFLDRMWQSSATFRRQVSRLAGTRLLV